MCDVSISGLTIVERNSTAKSKVLLDSNFISSRDFSLKGTTGLIGQLQLSCSCSMNSSCFVPTRKRATDTTHILYMAAGLVPSPDPRPGVGVNLGQFGWYRFETESEIPIPRPNPSTKATGRIDAHRSRPNLLGETDQSQGLLTGQFFKPISPRCPTACRLYEVPRGQLRQDKTPFPLFHSLPYTSASNGAAPDPFKCNCFVFVVSVVAL